MANRAVTALATTGRNDMRYMNKMLTLTAIGLLGCSDATGSLQGGDSIFSAPVVEAGAPDDASGGGSIAPSFCQDGGTNTGSGWKDLYACYFGPNGSVGPQGCGAGASCHDVGGAGAFYFTCPPTAPDPMMCWMGMMTVATGGTSDPTMTLLYSALRKPNPGNTLNNMPLSPANIVFQQADLDRITKWIQLGAPYN